MSTPFLIAEFANIFGGGELALIFAAIVILLTRRQLPSVLRGLRKGILEFRNACDDLAHDAGRSVGRIYGKPAAQALTPDNKTAELYDPAVFRKQEESRRAKLRRWVVRRFRGMRAMWHRFVTWLRP